MASFVSERIRHADLTALQGAVARRSSPKLNAQDREDLASLILSDSVAASQRTGIPIAPLALVGATRTRYYSDSRKRRERELAELQLPPSISMEADAEEEPDDPAAWDEVCEQGSDIGELIALMDLLDCIPEDERVAFYSCAICGETVAETALRLGISVSTVHSRVSRAREALKAAWLSAEAA